MAGFTPSAGALQLHDYSPAVGRSPLVASMGPPASSAQPCGHPCRLPLAISALWPWPRAPVFSFGSSVSPLSFPLICGWERHGGREHPCSNTTNQELQVGRTFMAGFGRTGSEIDQSVDRRRRLGRSVWGQGVLATFTAVDSVKVKNTLERASDRVGWRVGTLAGLWVGVCIIFVSDIVI